ncbi:winged helix-turn-helix domain-containing protein [Kitasatospora mediocidica]|uniref:winged helix-turn-helix domain-containing protein n=1 Tax=Kitasatospora mediocidica TaxID=58352 RepID=UPI00055BDD8B|nr:winged helix-turn-helix domain-containing protein [Kitasatospora mediocidica]
MADTHPDPTGPAVPGSEPDAIVLDAKGLRALAHPVRVQLVGLLRRHGPSTATLLAERMGLNSGATSYHLRQLGAAGFVAEDTERGNARERWWRAVHAMTSLSDIELVEQEPEAALAYLQSVTAVYTMRTQRALGEFQTMPRPWREVFDMSDWALLLTPEEAGALGEELHALVSRYRRDNAEGAAQAPAGAERVELITHLLPEPASDPMTAPAGAPVDETRSTP